MTQSNNDRDQKGLFPPEIMQFSAESYFQEENRTGRYLYLSLIIFVILILAILPLAKTEITIRCNGELRSELPSNPVIPVISGRIDDCRLTENGIVKKGDTLLVISTAIIDKQIHCLEDLISLDNFRLKNLANSGTYDDQMQEIKLRITENLTRKALMAEERKQHFLISPVNGTITDYSGVLPGNYALANQQIATICRNGDLIVACYVPLSSISLVSEGMSAAFRLLDFHSNKGSQLTGIVEEICPNPVTIQNRSCFIVHCRIDSTSMQAQNGATCLLRRGMMTGVKLRVTDRSLFQQIFDKNDISGHSTENAKKIATSSL